MLYRLQLPEVIQLEFRVAVIFFLSKQVQKEWLANLKKHVKQVRYYRLLFMIMLSLQGVF